jgi:3-oxoacyl-[acyl-carrier-protein] synthase III
VTNEALSRVCDTSDEWIRERTGIATRYYVADGTSTSDLGVRAARLALEDAKLGPGDIDYVVFATMTPDYVFPGSGALLAHKLGLPGVPALDIRQQCAAMLFGLQIIDGLIKSGAARTILFVGAEAHAGFMPWEDWDALDPAAGRHASPEQKERANKHRALAVLFGDGAGAFVFRATERDAGLRAMKLHTDGGAAKLLYVEGGGFRRRPYWRHSDYDEQRYIPTMDGRELFKFAVTKLPEAARAVCAETRTSIDKIDWFLAHQANSRINEYVREQLEVPASKLPSNIERFGNTSAGTLPILIDEQMRAGHLKHGDLCMLLALGAGVHWGCALVRW